MNRYFLLLFLINYCYSSFSQNVISQDSMINNLQDTIIDSLESQVKIREKAFEKYMELVKPKASVQGGACWGDYLFVGHDQNSYMDVYDLTEKEYVCKMSMNTPEPKFKCHSNTINFGDQFYKKGDEFPLLYVSSGYSISREVDLANVYVYRLTKMVIKEDSIVFNSDLVQTISIEGCYGWSECILDNEHDAIWIRYDRHKHRTFLKYSLPDIKKKEVFIDPQQTVALDTIVVRDFNVIKHNQGFLCHEGNIYFPIGVPAWGEEPYLGIINLDKKDYEYIVNLYDLEMYNPLNLRDNIWEPEFFFVYKDDYFIGYRSAIYKLNMDLVKQSNFFYNINYR